MNLIFFADRWDNKWRRRQQLASRMAKDGTFEHTVYVEQPLPVTSLAKFILRNTDIDGRERWSRLFSNRSSVMNINKKISVLTTFTPLPDREPAIFLKISERIRARWLLCELKRKFDIKRPVVWVSHPQIPLDVIKDLNPSMLWYDCTEDFTAWPGLPKRVISHIVEADKWLTENAGVITAVSRKIYNEKKQINPNTYWLPNAVDADMFTQAGKNISKPRELNKITGPVITFVGNMPDWAHDWELLDRVSSLRPGWTILLIGELSMSSKILSMLKNHSNIICTGIKQYEELPAYLLNSDACFQFYKPARANDTRNSQKLFLYFASGKPIISTPSADVEAYAEHVNIVNNAGEFITAVEESIKNDTDKKRERRLEMAKENSWDNRVSRIFEIYGAIKPEI